ncbi:hypothetical protein ACLOJK_037660 [Asimina triloba]
MTVAARPYTILNVDFEATIALARSHLLSICRCSLDSRTPSTSNDVTFRPTLRLCLLQHPLLLLIGYIYIDALRLES